MHYCKNNLHGNCRAQQCTGTSYVATPRHQWHIHTLELPHINSKSTSSGRMIKYKTYSILNTWHPHSLWNLIHYCTCMRDVPGYCCSKRHRNTMISATAWCMSHPWSWFGSSAQTVGPFYGEQHLGVVRLEVDSSCLCLRRMSLTSLVHHQDVLPAACADSARCRSICSTRRLRPRNPHLHMHQHHRHVAATLTNHPRARDCRLTWMQEWCTMQKSRRFNLDAWRCYIDKSISKTAIW